MSLGGDEMRAAICHICKDPIWSFICNDCLSSDIKNWLPVPLSKEFESFNHFFNQHFSGPLAINAKFENCIKCNEKRSATVCPYCYISEACQWLEPRNRILTKKLVRMLPKFPECKITREGEFVCKVDENVNKIETDIFNKKTRFGICDKCGEYSEELYYNDACWICEGCR